MIFSTCGVPAEKDEHTLLLLHCDDYSDSSMYGIELMDKSAQVSTEQSKFGGKSMYFNGSTRLSIDDVSARIFDFGTGISPSRHGFIQKKSARTISFSAEAPMDLFSLDVKRATLISELAVQEFFGTALRQFRCRQTHGPMWRLCEAKDRSLST